MVINFILVLVQGFAWAYRSETATSARSYVRYGSGLHSVGSQRNFTSYCQGYGISRSLCQQATYPNTDSKGSFRAVYGQSTPFVLMPSQDRWKTGVYLLGIAQSLSKYGKICEIRNWYRPEPYNSKVGGAGGSRHLDGSAIDIEFCSVSEKNKALQAALAMRQKHGAPAGVGVYGHGSLVLHIDTTNRIYGPGITNVASRVSRNQRLLNQVPNPSRMSQSPNQGGPLMMATPARGPVQQTPSLRNLLDFIFGIQRAA